MKFPQLTTGLRVVASFAVVLLLMACMTAVALWRLQSADDTASSLVHDKLARQQLSSELLGVARLNALRSISIARSDSLEVADYFQAQLAAGDKAQAAMEAKLAAMPQSPDEQALLKTVAARKAAYLAVRSEVFKFKDMGRVQEVSDLIDRQLEASFKAYVAAQEQLLAYQTQQARTLADESAGQFRSSRLLLAVLGLAALLTGAALAVALTRSIVRPLRQAAQLAV